MAEELLSEPPIKKAKMAETIDTCIESIIDSKDNLQAVLTDEVYGSVPFVKLYAAQVKDKKMLSNIILTLNEKFPLKGLQHLKRVNKSSVLLFPTSYLNHTAQETIQDFIELHTPELSNTFEYFKDIDVAALPPKTKVQYIECLRKWPCNFHPNKQLENILSGSIFKSNELRLHRDFMAIALRASKWYSEKNNLNLSMLDLLSSNHNIAVVVDPSISSVVAIALDNRNEHPMQHAAMVAIDNVAKTQNGGAWKLDSKEETLCGIDKEVVLYLKQKFPLPNFGARKFISKKDAAPDAKVDDSPYLCTGYDMYLIREPCIMCAMALVHARVKRVFFTFPNCNQGALKSKTKLHCVQSLNHRYEVYTGFF